MAFLPKRQIPLLSAVAIVIIVAALVLMRPPPQPAPLAGSPAQPADATPPEASEPSPSPAGMLSVLADLPDWEKLALYQNTITRSDFERLLTTVFTTGEAWRGYISISDTEAVIHTGRPGPEETVTLRFATGEPTPLPRNWLATHQLPAAPAEKPLEGLHIAIDPGHIGGEWAKMEERWFVVGDGQPVQEGDMTLFVAQLIRPMLESYGAQVTLVREDLQPVTPLRPESLSSTAQDAHTPQDSPEALRKFAERLFYRTAEIRARAQLVNETIRPDLVLCLHFNAEAWGDPANPTLIENTHLHLLLNGAYNDEEVSLSDQRFAMLMKLLQRTHEEEALVGATVAETFAEISALPAYQYPPNSPNARSVAGHPYLWARNLLANRLYDCPVIFLEPYVMNSTIDYARIQAGDYDGLREIEGKMLPSIFREYASALVTGLVRHYSSNRQLDD